MSSFPPTACSPTPKARCRSSIRNEADQRFFQDALDRAAVVVHGRHSHEGGPRAARRKRLVVTRQIAALAPDPEHPHALLWNPLGASLDQAIAQLGVSDGTIAIIGGPEVFSRFLPLYDAFHLSRAAEGQNSRRSCRLHRSRTECHPRRRARTTRLQARRAARSRSVRWSFGGNLGTAAMTGLESIR